VDGYGDDISNLTVLWVGTDPYVIYGAIESSGFYDQNVDIDKIAVRIGKN
jgi:hypothetical protein